MTWSDRFAAWLRRKDIEVFLGCVALLLALTFICGI